MLRPLLLAALIGAVAPPAHAQVNGALRAYAWANEASAASYTPDPRYAYNASGGAVTAHRTGTGQYYVTFGGVDGTGGTVQVSAYGPPQTDATCSVEYWEPSPLEIYVKCVDTGSTDPVDARYTVAYFRADADAVGLRYAYADRPADASALLVGDTVHNPGGVVSSTRLDEGAYRVRFVGVPEDEATRGVVLVTPVSSSAHCAALSWAFNSGGLDVRVDCSDAGDLIDSRFTVLFVSKATAGETPGFAYTHADTPGADPYSPAADGSYVFGGGSVLVERVLSGRYEVHFGGLGSSEPGGLALVTATTGAGEGAGVRHCTVGGWNTTGPDVSVAVNCGGETGGISDSHFAALFLWPTRPGATAAAGGPDTGPDTGDGAAALRLAGPNPTVGRAAFAVDLTAPADARLDVFDAVGRRALALDLGPRSAGTHAVEVDASALPAGVYVARLVAGEAVRTARFTVAR